MPHQKNSKKLYVVEIICVTKSNRKPFDISLHVVWYASHFSSCIFVLYIATSCVILRCNDYHIPVDRKLKPRELGLMQSPWSTRENKARK